MRLEGYITPALTDQFLFNRMGYTDCMGKRRNFRQPLYFHL